MVSDAGPTVPHGWKDNTVEHHTVVSKMKEICLRGNNNIVIIIFLVHDNVYIPC
jgi:hypothetical protein